MKKSYDIQEKIENTVGKQGFTVPNNDEGKLFMRLLAKFINRKFYRCVKRGRGKRLTRKDGQSIPLDRSDWVAVYLKGGEIDAIRDAIYNKEQVNELANKNLAYYYEVIKLKKRIATLELELANALKEKHEPVNFPEVKQTVSIVPDTTVMVGTRKVEIIGATMIKVS